MSNKQKININIIFFLLITNFILIISCSEPFELPKDDVKKANVNIVIGGSHTAGRTIVPDHRSIAGYRLTFEPELLPINFSGTDNKWIYLPDGDWKIIATAYRKGTEIGSPGNEVARGEISIIIENDSISGGTVPQILLEPEGIGEGFIYYSVNHPTFFSGTFSIINDDNGTIITSLPINNRMFFSGSVKLNKGRYIVVFDIRNHAGRRAFHREVVEVWPYTTTNFSFKPIFVNPKAGLPNEEAVLSEEKTRIGGSSLGDKLKGEGNSDTDPKEYRCYPANITLNLIFEEKSLYSTISWAITLDNSIPGSFNNYNSLLIPSNIEANTFLWLRTVSEDTRKTLFYKIELIPPISNGQLNIAGENVSSIEVSGNTMRITQNGDYIIGMRTGAPPTTSIIVNNDVEANITLIDVIIDLSSTDSCALDLAGAKVELKLVGDSILKSGESRAGINITGGTLSITGENTATLDVAGGADGIGGTGGSITKIDEHTVIYASSIPQAILNAAAKGPAIIFNGFDGEMYGNVIITRDIYIPWDRKLSIENGQILTIQAGYTLWNNHNVIRYPEGIINGSIYPAFLQPYFSVSPYDSGVSYSRGILRITGSGQYTISRRSAAQSQTSLERIVVSQGTPAKNITLNNININLSNNSGICAFDMSGATVNLTLVGNNNHLASGFNRAGIEAPASSSLTILESSGRLTVTGGTNGAGIGGGYNSASGTIRINGSTVTAMGNGGADIGGGSGASGTSTTLGNSAVVFVSSRPGFGIQPDLPAGGNYILFRGNDGIMIGNITLSRNVEIDQGRKLVITGSQRLTIQSSNYLTNNGIIIVDNIGNNITNEERIIGYGLLEELAFVITPTTNTTYERGILTISGSENYLIRMRAGGTNPTKAQNIVVAAGGTKNITIENVSIDLSNLIDISAFEIIPDATVNLTLNGTNNLSSGSDRAGLEVPSGVMLNISGAGSLTAAGGWNGGAGIGSRYYNNAGTINIANGTITAMGNGGAAGIGGGNYGGGGNISITGGRITATGAGIGHGNGSTSGTITEIRGNAIVETPQIRPALPTGANLGPAMIFINNDGTLYGSFTLGRAYEIPTDRFLTIPNGSTLNVPGTQTLTNNGMIFVREDGNYTGTISNIAPIRAAFTISGGTSYTYTRAILNITGAGDYTISMVNGVESTTNNRIVASTTAVKNITLSSVNIDMSSSNPGLIAFDMTGATVNLTLIGTNVLAGGNNRAALQVPSGAALTINAASTGSLTATGGTNSAGIGGGSGFAGGTMNFNGGVITATGGSSGIGGGFGFAGGTINSINGNTIIFASTIQPPLPPAGNLGPAIIFNGNNGFMHRDVELQQDVTFNAGRILNIESGQILTIPSGITLRNNGIIYNRGTINHNDNIIGSGEIIDITD